MAELATDDPSILRAKLKLDRVRKLVESGSLPKIKLEEAEMDLADTVDEATLTKALYGKDLTVEQAQETVLAAKRRLEGHKKVSSDQQKLVETGAIRRSEITASQDDLDRAQKEYEWAVARVQLVRGIEAAAELEAEAEKQAQEMKDKQARDAPRLAKLRAQRAAEAKVMRIKQEADARIEKTKREEQAKAEHARLEAKCRIVYDQTANKKVVDLTVTETRQIRACEQLDLYSH